MPKFKLNTRLAILVTALVVITFHFAYPSRDASRSHWAATHHEDYSHASKGNLVELPGKQGSLYQPKSEYDEAPEETPEEKWCFNSGTQSSDPIPKVVNFIWINQSELTFLNYLAIRAALVSLQPDRVNLHHNHLNYDDQWLRKLGADINLVQHDLHQEYPKQVQENWFPEHISDIMRLDILQRDGGIYLDMDCIALRSFDDLLHSPKDIVLAHEGKYRVGLANSIILARRGAAFIDRWKASYKSFRVGEWNTHSVRYPKQWSLEFPEEVCTLSPSVFFWPLWGSGIDYMHDRLFEDDAREFKRRLDSNGGSMYPHQLSYHAWHHSVPKLDTLTPEFVQLWDTRFNIMVRRFIE